MAKSPNNNADFKSWSGQCRLWAGNVLGQMLPKTTKGNLNRRSKAIINTIGDRFAEEMVKLPPEKRMHGESEAFANVLAEAFNID